MRIALLLCLTCSLPIAGSVRLDGAPPGRAKESLRGLPGLQVVVEEFDTVIEEHGLNEADIQADVERQLRLAGITVLEADGRRAIPYVFIQLGAQPGRSGGAEGMYEYTLHVSVRQAVRQPSEQRTRDAATWDAGWPGAGGAGKLRNARADVTRYVGQLIADWLAVNPKR